MSSMLKQYRNRINPVGQQKPQGALRIDWTHPLTEGLCSYAIDFDGIWFDLVSGVTGNCRDSGGSAAALPPSGVSLGGVTTAWDGTKGVRLDIPDKAMGGSTLTSGTVATGYVLPSSNASGGPIIAYSTSSLSNGYVDFEITNLNMNSFVGNEPSPPGVVIALNTFQSLATVVTSTTSNSVYLNGVLQASDSGYTAGNFFLPGSLPKLTIASFSGGSVPIAAYVYYGAVWNRVLTSTDLTQLHYDPWCFLVPVEGEMPALFLPGGYTPYNPWPQAAPILSQ